MKIAGALAAQLGIDLPAVSDAANPTDDDVYKVFSKTNMWMQDNASAGDAAVYDVLKDNGVEIGFNLGGPLKLTGYKVDVAKLRRVNPADIIRPIKENDKIQKANELKDTLKDLLSDSEARDKIATQVIENSAREFGLKTTKADWLAGTDKKLSKPIAADPQKIKELGKMWEHATGSRPQWATHTPDEFREFCRERAQILIEEGRTDELTKKDRDNLARSYYCETSVVKGLPTNYTATIYVRPDEALYFNTMLHLLCNKDGLKKGVTYSIRPENDNEIDRSATYYPFREETLNRSQLGFPNPLFKADSKLEEVKVFRVEDAGPQTMEYLNNLARECQKSAVGRA